MLWRAYGELFTSLPDDIALRDISETRALWLYRPARKRNLYLSPLLRPWRFRRIYSDGINLHPGAPSTLADEIRNTAGDILLRSGTFFYPVSAQAYRSLFHPVPTIRDAADKLLATLGTDAVGFHIRRTDNTVAIASSPVETFLTRATTELSTSPGRKIYLATDDDTVKDLFHNRFPEKIVTTADTADRTTPTGMAHALTEMLVLAGCTRIVGSYYSSYSEAAALIGDTPLEQINVTAQ